MLSNFTFILLDHDSKYTVDSREYYTPQLTVEKETSNVDG